MSWFWKKRAKTHDTYEQYIEFFLKQRIGPFRKSCVPTDSDTHKPGVVVKAQYSKMVHDSLRLHSVLQVDMNSTKKTPTFSETAQILADRYGENITTPEDIASKTYERMLADTKVKLKHSLLLEYHDEKPAKCSAKFEKIHEPVWQQRPLYKISTETISASYSTVYSFQVGDHISAFDLLGGEVDPKRANWLEHDPTVGLLVRYEKELRQLQSKPDMYASIRLGTKMMKDNEWALR